LSASESRIRNVDVAKESANLTKNQILQQASSTILAQANQAPQLALSLLR
jgi:flagellin